MKHLVSVRDSKTEVFGQPAMVNTLAEGERMFADLASDGSTLIGKHPEDFALYCVGRYDESNGSIDTLGCPFIVSSR